MKERKITLSLKKIKFFGSLVSLIFLLFIFFAVVESNLISQKDTARASALIASPTPFHSDENFSFDNHILAIPTITPYPTLDYEEYTPTPQALPTISNITPYNLPPNTNPLTGLSPSAPNLLERRPIASKITLYPRYVRPQSGLSLADIVFEYYIEGGLTRFVAVFYGNNAERVGPVRSGRFFDEHIARMYQSYLVFKYADPRVYSYLKSTNISKFLVVPGARSCPPFLVGAGDRDTYNNIFFNATKFADCLAKEGKDNARPDLQAGYFSMFPPLSAEPAQGIFTQYSLDDYHNWGYEPLSHKYLRNQETKNLRDNSIPSYAPLIDALTGQQVSADNVVFLFVPHTFDNKYQEEDEVYHIDLIGSGKAFLFRDGIVLPAYWRRAAIDQPLLLTDPSGMPISLRPGRTFYEILGENSTYQTQYNQWYFRFDTP